MLHPSGRLTPQDTDSIDKPPTPGSVLITRRSGVASDATRREAFAAEGCSRIPPPLPKNEAPGVVRTSGALSFSVTERTVQLSEKFWRRTASLVTPLITLGVLASRDNAIQDEVAVEIIFLVFRLAFAFGFCMHPRASGPNADSLSDLVFADVEHHEILRNNKRSAIVFSNTIDHWQDCVGIHQNVGSNCQSGRVSKQYARIKSSSA